MNDIHEMIEQYIAETGEAHFEFKPTNGLGVVFHDENEFILLADLAYNSQLGFFQVSLFPDAEREAEYQEPQPAQWVSAVFDAYDGENEYQMWAVIPDDGTKGFIIGEWDSVMAVRDALDRLIESGQADERVNELDERLGHRWLSVSEAAEKFNVPTDTVRYAAREGFIPMAQKRGNEWRFPQRKFLYWLNRIYQPKK